MTEPAENRTAPQVPAAMRHTRRFAAIGSASGAVGGQLVLAGGSLALQLVAARTMGAEGFGSYVLVYGLVVLIISVYTSWVGDALTVFDRFDPPVRGAILVSVLVGVAGGVLTSTLVVGWFLSFEQSLAVIGLTAMWILNETGRRIFTARMEFWRLAFNDALGLLITAAGLVLMYFLDGRVTLLTMILALCGGNLAAVIAARCRLPSGEYKLVRLRGSAFRTVMGFSLWRALQAGVRPLALQIARSLVVLTASRTALAGLEVARLLVAPALTVAGGFGSYFLSRFGMAGRNGLPGTSRTAARASLIMGASMVVLALVPLAFASRIESLIGSGDIEVDPLAVFGWAVYSVVFASTLPLSGLATARRDSRFVFLVRALEMALGLVVFAVLLIVDTDLVWTAPLCLSLGGLVSAVIVWRRLRRTDPPEGRRVDATVASVV
ncbi:UNVERIFIED_CONTAM: O-antigen/teichoic acid export membrane protein [Williamsia faeni]